MKIIITVKTGKGLKSTKKEIDKTVDTVLLIGELINNKYKKVQEGGQNLSRWNQFDFREVINLV